MRLEFLPEARAEFYEACAYYEDKEAGLGIRFRVITLCIVLVAAFLEWMTIQ